jgi:chromosome segregation ATPase
MDTEAIYRAVFDYGTAKRRGYNLDADDHLSEIKRLLKEAEDERAELLKENERLVDEVNEARKETSEQARLNGMGAEREARLMAEVAELKAKLAKKAELLRGCYAADHKRQKRVAELKSALQMSRDALAGGLWDYGPGQDEHDKCNEVIAAIDAALKEDKTC